MPCPPGVTYCVTVSALPPVTWTQLINGLLETDTMGLLQRAVRSTLGAKPLQFALNVLLPNRNGDYRLDEVVYGVLAYFSGVNPDPSVSIYPGERFALFSVFRAAAPAAARAARARPLRAPARPPSPRPPLS